MSLSDSNDALVLAEFYDRFWSDRAAQQSWGLEHYLDQFPGHRELISSEYASLVGSEEITDDEAPKKSMRSSNERIGHYRLLEVLGRGGQAIVWLAEDERVARKVALKLFRGDSATAPTQVLRFKREAALSAKIDHPAICPMLDFGLDDRPWIAMRYVPGQTLAELLRRPEGAGLSRLVDLSSSTGAETESSPPGMLTPTTGARPSYRLRALLEMIEKVARAIHAAHEVGVIHRDLKPNNIMIQPDGEPVVLDFGIAVDESSDSLALTATDDVVGTPAYVSPEQIGTGRAVDRRTDLHALGVILFECLCGRRPFEAVNRDLLYRAILHEDAPRLREIDPTLSQDIEVVVAMCLQKNPDHRYVDALALAGDLRRIIENRPILARPVGSLRRGLRWAQRNRALALSLATIILLLSVGLLVTWSLLRNTRAALSRESRALSERQDAFDEVSRQKHGVFRLKAQNTLHELRREASEDLWPVAARNLKELDESKTRISTWLRQAEELGAALDEEDPETTAPGHRRQLEWLRARARTRSPAEIDAALKAHPRFPELQAIRARRDAEVRGHLIRSGGKTLDLPEIDPATIPASPPEHMKIILGITRSSRKVFGREAEGLARAKLLEKSIEGMNDPLALFWVGATMTWAQLANGQDVTSFRAPLEEYRRLNLPENQQAMLLELNKIDAAREERTAAAWPGLIADLDQQAKQLELEIMARDRWHFDSDEDQWWHDQLCSFITELESFAGETGPIRADSPEKGWSVDHRLRFLGELSQLHQEAATAWAEARERIARNANYQGLDLAPQLGLIPIGPDPTSGLEEFWEPASGSRPFRTEGNGRLLVTEETGLVFVLIPAGTFTMGAQNAFPQAPGYDAGSLVDEGPVKEVDVPPYFISKFEMTQGQYLRLAIENPSSFPPNLTIAGTKERFDLRHPVDSVSWEGSRALLQRFGLALPTEAEWEFAARAGTTTRWWSGAEAGSLNGAENLADLSALGMRVQWPGIADAREFGLDDGLVFPGPVGSLRANPFGLYDVLGNVGEWVDGRVHLVTAEGRQERLVSRGGHFMSRPFDARVTFRYTASSTAVFQTVGIRPARPIR